jgi:guanylate kinase
MGGGSFYVISAPSGTGKTTILKRVLGEFPETKFSVSYTTRSPRPGEKEGVEYHFVSRDEFQRMIQAGAFAEWTELLGHYYGTSKAFLEESLNQGIDVILDIDTQGADQIQKGYRDGVYIFILPPEMEDLKKRLTRRGSETQEVIDLRIQNASKEIQKMGSYDYVVINDRIDAAVERIKAIILAERCRRDRVLRQLEDTVTS